MREVDNGLVLQASRGLLYGLEAILRLHTTQEDETYLALDDPDLLDPAAGPRLMLGIRSSGSVSRTNRTG